MLPVTHILCPIDFSESSYKALQTAEELAVHFNAALTVLHVVQDIPVLPALPTNPSIDVPEYQEKLEEAARIALDMTIKDKVSSVVEAQAMIRSGRPADIIIDVADELKPGFLVISTHGESGVAHFVFGSVAEKVIRHASCPVLTVQADGVESK
jgi:nucleotide-binding universal stress UspA family protein